MTDFIKYLFSGTFFGFLLVKSEVVSWFRIQEMFRFDSFHMYGILMSAILVGLISIQLIKRFKIRNFNGLPIFIPGRRDERYVRFLCGGTIFGLGWALTGACPGPLYSLAGAGYTVFIIPIISAIFGTWVYGRFMDYLPH